MFIISRFISPFSDFIRWIECECDASNCITDLGERRNYFLSLRIFASRMVSCTEYFRTLYRYLVGFEAELLCWALYFFDTYDTKTSFPSWFQDYCSVISDKEIILMRISNTRDVFRRLRLIISLNRWIQKKRDSNLPLVRWRKLWMFYFTLKSIEIHCVPLSICLNLVSAVPNVHISDP